LKIPIPERGEENARDFLGPSFCFLCVITQSSEKLYFVGEIKKLTRFWKKQGF
jgi:penicillin-binding protein-related factor A (putative recombinase)